MEGRETGGEGNKGREGKGKEDCLYNDTLHTSQRAETDEVDASMQEPTSIGECNALHYA